MVFEHYMKLIKIMIKDWFHRLLDKILEDPIINIVRLFASGFVMYAFAAYFYEYFSIITLIGYVFLYIKGITSIIDDPRRIVRWAIGFFLGAIAFRIISEYLIPILDFKDITSVISVIFILYIIFIFFFKSRVLKNS